MICALFKCMKLLLDLDLEIISSKEVFVSKIIGLLVKLLPVSMFTEILEAHDLSHFTEVDSTQVCVGAFFMTDA